MKNITIREVEERDLPALKSLIAEAFGEGWNLKRFAQNSELTQALLSTYLSIFLEPATFGRVAELDGEVIGVTLCSAKGETEKFRQFQSGTMPNALTLLTAADSERADIVEHISTSFQTIMQLVENKIAAYDGSLELLVVSAKAQGLKIGKMLWNEAAAYFKSCGAKSVYLIADSKCNVGFYNHNGFSKTDTKEAVYNYTTEQRKNNIFLYEYQF